MKLMTLNCHSWQEDNQLAKIKILAERIKKEQYDVIALQEISQHVDGEYISGNIKSDNYDYNDEISNKNKNNDLKFSSREWMEINIIKNLIVTMIK